MFILHISSRHLRKASLNQNIIPGNESIRAEASHRFPLIMTLLVPAVEYSNSIFNSMQARSVLVAIAHE